MPLIRSGEKFGPSLRRFILLLAGPLIFLTGYLLGNSGAVAAQAQGHPAGIPKSYGHLVSAVVNPKGTALVFEDAQGVIRFVSITGELESELTRN